MGVNTISADDLTQPLVSIRRLVRTLRTSASAVERSTGLSSAQLFVLQVLNEEAAGSVNQLAARTMTDQSSVSVVVSRLEEKGLVSRSPDPDDARRTKVSITPEGQQLIDGAPMTVQGRLVIALRALPPYARDLLAQLLDDLTNQLGAADEPATFLFEDDATGAH